MKPRDLPREIFVPDNELAVYFPVVGTEMGPHRAALKMHLLKRDGACWVQGCSGDGIAHMHEFIRRSDVAGWPRCWRCLIFNPFCAIILCGKHHNTYLEPSREEVADWMLATYGRQVVGHYESLPFKVNPLRGWLEKTLQGAPNVV